MGWWPKRYDLIGERAIRQGAKWDLRIRYLGQVADGSWALVDTLGATVRMQVRRPSSGAAGSGGLVMSIGVPGAVPSTPGSVFTGIRYGAATSPNACNIQIIIGAETMADLVDWGVGTWGLEYIPPDYSEFEASALLAGYAELATETVRPA